ncbi:MAG: endonuclease/exonuclease/phosphatase family protein [Oscillospiraceae bacterium]|nr:endonuclease/exonuclease/phosphatase family protein [Oscillospiraceae bacterium]
MEHRPDTVPEDTLLFDLPLDEDLPTVGKKSPAAERSMDEFPPKKQTPPTPDPMGDIPSSEEDDSPTVVPQPKRKRKSCWTVVWAVSKFIWKLALALVLIVGILLFGMVGFLTVTEYNPAFAETADRGSVNRTETIVNRSLSLLSFNTGYAGLGADADFFMDGGEGVLPAEEASVQENMEGIQKLLSLTDTDFIFLQEVDTDSQRSFNTNQWLKYEKELKDYESRFALNHSCSYVPYPFTQPMGKIHSGIATYSSYDIVSATRYSLPNPFSWPTRIANLKRCLLVTRIPIEDSEQQLVLINVHMEAYDDGSGKSEQTRQLISLVKEEYAKGNYVIAGGDFNQSFPESDAFPVKDPQLWTPGVLTRISDGFKYCYDDSTPTCRLLNQPYDPDSEDTQFYVIDGFLVSPNITIDRVETLDYDFLYSDHNPVLLEFTLNADTE